MRGEAHPMYDEMIDIDDDMESDGMEDMFSSEFNDREPSSLSYLEVSFLKL